MSKAPWYKRYAADFISDPYVQAMTAEQYGWFSAMLDVSWIHSPIGRLPNDLSLICRMIGRCDEMYFVQHSKIVIDRFKVSEDGKWLYHPRMLEQAEKVVKVSENKSHPGRSGRKKNPQKDEIIRKSDDFQNEIKRGVDSDSEPDIYEREIGGEDLSEKVARVALSHPRNSHLKHESEIPMIQCESIAAAIARDGFELVYAGTLNLRDAVAKWPASEKRYAPNPNDFYTQSQYRKDPAEWERSDGKSQSVRVEQPSRAQQRIQRNRETFAAALRARHPDLAVDGPIGPGDEGRDTRARESSGVAGCPIVLPPGRS